MCKMTAPEQAAERARWLANVSQALNDAHRLLFALDERSVDRATLIDLHERIEAARLQVQSLRLSRSFAPRPQTGPEWIGFMPWSAD